MSVNSLQVHVWPVIVAALVQWVIGAIWYGVGFRKSWSKLVGGGMEGVTPGRRAFAMICSFVASIILCFVMANVLAWAGTATFMGGVAMAIICWLGFMAPPMFAQHIYERRPANLFAINAAYWMVAMAISGGVLGVWR